jgi:DNA-binding MarR family transcriptional regulator
MSKAQVPPPLLGALLRIPLEVIQRRIIAALHAHGFEDLGPAHLPVLRYPGPDGKRPVELAAETNMSKQAMNYLLGQLEALGYLERRDDPEDRRFKRVYVTDRGDATREVIRTAVRELEREWADELGPRELDELRVLLTRLGAVVESSARSARAGESV